MQKKKKKKMGDWKIKSYVKRVVLKLVVSKMFFTFFSREFVISI